METSYQINYTLTVIVFDQSDLSLWFVESSTRITAMSTLKWACGFLKLILRKMGCVNKLVNFNGKPLLFEDQCHLKYTPIVSLKFVRII